ncbi:MAG: hypothetical protein U5N26_03680 [Candidatus Marinimicrobia bacterium]|nr:hypothetical protein [Candidatus Neomarinimicrobiota bacterium]
MPAHFPKDEFSLDRLTAPPFMNMRIPARESIRTGALSFFNYGRNEVANFLISNALYWLKEFHADGLRIDAVASMLYLDYSREEGEWLPNRYGGNENLEAIEFMKRLSTIVGNISPPP